MGSIISKINQKRNSIMFMISISFVVLIITIFIILGYIIFSNWNSSARSSIKNIANDTKKVIYGQMDSFISIPLNINEFNHRLIENRIVNLDDRKELESYFAGIMKSSNQDVYSFTYGSENAEYYGARRNENGDIELIKNNAETNGESFYYSINKDLTIDKLVGKTEKFDCRTRDWYKAAKEKQKPIFSQIYKHFVMNDLAISASYPIYNKNGNLQGVLGTHIILSKVNNFLNEIAKDKKADIYIVEKSTGELVGNSVGMKNFKTIGNNEIKRNTIEDVDDKYIKLAYENFTNDTNNDFEVKREKDKFYVTVTDYRNEGIDWLIITVINEGRFIDDITRSIQLSLILSTIAIFLAILIYMKNTKAILKPVYNLIKTTQDFAAGEFTKRATILKNDEIGTLSKAFNSMADDLYLFINNLEEMVTKRTIELGEKNVELKNNKEDLQLLFNSTGEAIYGVDMNGNCTFCNLSGLKMLGYDKEEDLLGKNLHLFIHHANFNGEIITEDKYEIFSKALKGEYTHSQDEIFWRVDGTKFFVEYFAYPQYRDGIITGAVITCMDITERKIAEENIIYLSYHDQLTGLYNRRYFEAELQKLDNPEYYPLTIIMADMNGLKIVNDSFGHAKGDELLIKVSEVLRKGCKKDDLIARLGGDEFVIILKKTNGEGAENIIRRIKDIAEKETVNPIDISISFGHGTKNNEKEEIKDIFKIAEDNMYRKKLLESPSMRGKTINTIIHTLHEKNEREEAHSHRVSELCYRMGIELGFSDEEIQVLKTVGLLHDIGKIAVDDNILNKEGKLTDDEFDAIKRHPEIGYRIVNASSDMSDIAKYILYHHERWDGKGYPKGLKANEIPIQSRIIAIADAYDAMTSNRSYRKALDEDWAIQELKQNVNIQFDQKLVSIFIEKVLNRSYD